MAIHILNEPDPVTSAYKPVVFSLYADTLATGSFTTKIAYQLLDSVGNAITNLESFTPMVEDVAYDIDFQRDVAPYVATFIPNINHLAVIEDTMISKSFRLRFFEITVDSISCEPEIGANQFSEYFTVVNGVAQYYEHNLLNDSVAVLSHQPQEFQMCLTAMNNIWIKGTTQVKLTAKDKNGTLSTVKTSNLTHDYNIYPFNAYFSTMSVNNISELQLEIVEIGKIYKIAIVDCQCDKGRDWQNIMFLDQYGGRSMMSFESVDSFEISNDFEVIEKYTKQITPPLFPNYDTINNLTHGGKSILNKSVKDTINLRFSTKYSDDYKAFFKAFFASTGYFIQTNNPLTNEPHLRKFIVNNGQFVYSKNDENIELQISGYMAHDYINQSFDRY